ncbi:dihydroneopterin aldolase [uncultured Muriicola sp.]|uniref:dihydroneopterin aldolase n=1 Tax=uncultured Muriicola sp. TaxID=1583102 RepID=UPI002629B6C1|nr:dihydroneopterin aldolase [uncultured Muriicola sp.]
MDTITLNNIKLYAYHGCLEEEARIGSEYRVDVVVKADLRKAASTDSLKDTADYVLINHIVKEEMKIPSKLLEHVARRIADRILKEIGLVTKGKISVSKINPPIRGDVSSVSVGYSFSR